ncbi:MAG: ornithine acetyltransferase [Microcystaceae cyanobacterium]
MTQVNLNSDEKFCKKVLNCRKIKDKLVILCEGNRDYLNIHTPQQISQLEKGEDANFWRNTIPRWWRNQLPVFIPCGGRSDVLRIRQRLIELHYEDPENSYLSPDKLYALIDLDVQSANLDHCSTLYQTTEDLYHAIYQSDKIDTNSIQESHIIITGWIHKEAYFLEPDLEDYLQQPDSNFNLYYQDQPLEFDKLYQDMIDQIINDKDIENNLPTIIERVKENFTISCENQTTLQTELKNAYNSSHLTPKKKET